MRIHHLNCGTMHPFGMPLADDTGGVLKKGQGVIHCVLVDTGAGLALIDTGWGMRDYTDSSSQVRQFMMFTGCSGDPDETAIRQIEALGYAPGDVKHIFLTHMHLDHAGGLPDFPAASVHLMADELKACLHPRTLMEWWTYRPEHHAHNPRWQPHALQGKQWFGLDCAAPVQVGEAEFAMIPFPGHTRGHSAVALRVGKQWLLHCGDAYGYHRQVGTIQPYVHPCGKLIETLVTKGFKMPKRQRTRIRKLLQAHGDQIKTFCSHDAYEFKLFDEHIGVNL